MAASQAAFVCERICSENVTSPWVIGLATRSIDKAVGAFRIDRVPPVAIELQRTGDDDAIDDAEDVAHVVGSDATADKRR